MPAEIKEYTKVNTRIILSTYSACTYLPVMSENSSTSDEHTHIYIYICRAQSKMAAVIMLKGPTANPRREKKSSKESPRASRSLMQPSKASKSL
jgi:hypothetical protein